MPEVFEIKKENELTIRVSRYQIDEAVQFLHTEGECFISDIDGSYAWKCRKRIMKYFQDEDVIVKSYRGDYVITVTGKKHPGFFFKLIKTSKD